MDPIHSKSTDAWFEDELHALVDGRLPDARRRALEARLALDPAAAATRLAWQRQRDALKDLHGHLLSEPVPAPLAAAAEQAALVQRRVDPWWRWGGMAAAVVFSFGLGWLSHGQYTEGPFARSAGTYITTDTVSAREFARQASVAHLVFAPEQRHPVEVPAAQQEHLVQWLSKRLDRRLIVPNLSAQGYELVGGRLLPGHKGARAQFMFQNSAGERITLYLGAMSEPAATSPTQAGLSERRETAFSFSTDGPVPGFYWVDRDFGYALAGPLPREKLMLLARSVHQQL